MIALKTGDSRTIRVADEILWEYGRVVYQVDKVGSFTVERDHFGNIDYRADSLYVAYGRVDTPHHPQEYNNPTLPDAPVISGVTIANGGCGFSPDKLLEELDGGKPYIHEWPVWRTPRATAVSDATRKRVKYICVALMVHYLDRPEYQAIERARARYLAPGRLSQHRERITELRQGIAAREAELAEQLVMADRAAALTAPDLAGLSARR